jgi:hypothetical protein
MVEPLALRRNWQGRHKPGSVRGLEELGRVRLSRNFFLRDFLLSEIAVVYGLRNVPDNPDLAIEAGKKLCEELLEPIQSKFGRVAIRSAYRSCAVNALGNHLGLSCASNERNYARHIWDRRARDGSIGAMACIVVPWLVDHVAKGGDWKEMAWWIHRHLPYSELQFFPRLTAFNIGWRERPRRRIYSFIRPRGLLTLQETPNSGREHLALAST